VKEERGVGDVLKVALFVGQLVIDPWRCERMWKFWWNGAWKWKLLKKGALMPDKRTQG